MKKSNVAKKRNRWAAASLLLLGIALLLTAAYAVTLPKVRAGARQTAVEIFADVILPMADDSTVYFDALDFVRAYVSQEESLERTLDALERAENELRARQDSSGEAELPAQTARTLKKAGIAPEEFREFFGARAFGLEEYLWSLTSLKEYLTEMGSEFAFEEVQYWTKSLDILRDTYWGILYYDGVNRWFAQWDEKAADCVRGQILEQLPEKLSDRYPWETELSVIENKTVIFRKYRETYYELPMGYTLEEREAAARLRDGYESQEALIFPQGSWLYSLLDIKRMRESTRGMQRLIERNDEYNERYREELPQ